MRHVYLSQFREGVITGGSLLDCSDAVALANRVQKQETLTAKQRTKILVTPDDLIERIGGVGCNFYGDDEMLQNPEKIVNFLVTQSVRRSYPVDPKTLEAKLTEDDKFQEGELENYVKEQLKNDGMFLVSSPSSWC